MIACLRLLDAHPDSLASELLDGYETTSNADYRQAAEAIFESDASNLRRILNYIYYIFKENICQLWYKIM
jgi:hypothetical protein